jgi:hypothetical protein
VVTGRFWGRPVIGVLRRWRGHRHSYAPLSLAERELETLELKFLRRSDRTVSDRSPKGFIFGLTFKTEGQSIKRGRTPAMTRSYDPNEIVVLARLITQAVADLGSRDESDKELIADRILSLAEKGERSFQKLLAAAEHQW